MSEEIVCPCCRLTYWATDNPDGFGDPVSPLHASVLCRDCANHQGASESVRRARVNHHFKMLRREYGQMQERVKAAEEATTVVAHEYAMRPVRTIIRIENLDQIIVDRAKEERDDAYRRRDTAMGALSDVRVIHHRRPDNHGRCKCGQAFELCEVAQIVDAWPGVTAWEKSQARRGEQGGRHHLRRDHSALEDPSYFEDRYGA